MKKIFLTICFCLIASISFGAELLVITKDGSHHSHAKKGDIIAVVDNGHEWGKKEGLPLFVVIKIPEMTMEEAKLYEEQLTEEVDVEIEGVFVKRQKVVRDRKYKFDNEYLDTVIAEGKSVKEINPKEFEKLKIKKKDLVDEKIKVNNEK